MAYALEALGKQVRHRQRRRRAGPLPRVPRRGPHRDRAPATGRVADARHRHGVQRPDAHGRGRPRRPLHHQHRPPRRQPDVRRAQLVRRVGRGVRRDGVRHHRGARRAAHPGDRHAHLPRDPDRHRLVPSLEHHAAHVRHLPADASKRASNPATMARARVTTATASAS